MSYHDPNFHRRAEPNDINRGAMIVALGAAAWFAVLLVVFALWGVGALASLIARAVLG